MPKTRPEGNCPPGAMGTVRVGYPGPRGTDTGARDPIYRVICHAVPSELKVLGGAPTKICSVVVSWPRQTVLSSLRIPATVINFQKQNEDHDKNVGLQRGRV